MKLRSQEMPMDPQIERELEAMVAELEADLGELRPAPSEEFAARLDASAAAGFGGGRGPAGSRIWERIREIPPRRYLMTAGAGALAAVVVATAVSIGGSSGTSSSSLDGGNVVTSQASLPSGAAASKSAGAGAGASDSAAGSAPVAGSGGAGAVPRTPDAAGGAATAAPTAPVVPGTAGVNSPDEFNKTGPFASQAKNRAVERSASLTLGTDPEGVRDASAKVYDIVGRYSGIVLNSSIRDGGDGEAGAEFDLLIPTERLSGALADFSGIAEVRSREENAQDITAPTVTVQEHLRDARAEVEGLLKQLANADTDSQRASVKYQLRFQRQRVASLRASLNNLQRRANLSHVSLQIVTGDATSFAGSGNDSWTLGDAVHDAGRVLAVAAGVILVGLAVLAPIALIALLIWLVRRSWVRQRREHALGGSS